MANAWDAAKGLADKHASSGGLFIRLSNDGDKVVGAFCGEPFAREVVWTGERYETFDPKNPEHQVEGRRPSLRVALNFFVPAENAMKVIEVGTATFKDVLRCRDKYTLTGWLFEIERHGEARSSRTTYSVLPDKQIDAELRAKLDRAELHDLEALVGDGAREPAPAASASTEAPAGNIDAATAAGVIGRMKALPRDIVDSLLARFRVQRVREVRAVDVPALLAELERAEGGNVGEIDPFA